MIKIYDRPMETDPKDDIYFYDIAGIRYNFHEDENNIYIEAFLQYSSNSYDETEGSYQIAINKLLYAGQILMVTLSRPNPITIYNKITFSTKFNSLLGKIYHGKEFPKKFNIVSLWIPSDYKNESILIMPHMRTDPNGNRVDGCEYEEIELVNEDPQTTLISKSEAASIKKESWMMKRQSITPLLDPFESISYLEGQVDVLTKIIKMLVDKTGIDVGEYKDLLDSMESSNLINIKPLDMINADIVKDKNKAREVQKEYYKAKYGV